MQTINIDWNITQALVQYVGETVASNIFSCLSHDPKNYNFSTETVSLSV